MVMRLGKTAPRANDANERDGIRIEEERVTGTLTFLTLAITFLTGEGEEKQGGRKV